MNWLSRNVTGTGVMTVLFGANVLLFMVWGIQTNIEFEKYLAKNKLVYVKGYTSIKPDTIIYEDYKEDK